MYVIKNVASYGIMPEDGRRITPTVVQLLSCLTKQKQKQKPPEVSMTPFLPTSQSSCEKQKQKQS
jgi:hypothetical protein